jgi:Flp pilus assembly protein TadG
MIRRLLALARSQDGTAAVELAVVAPVLAMMVAGVADLSIAYGRELEIQQAAQRAIEKVMQTSGSDTPEGAIKKEACIQINGSEEVTANGVTTVECADGRIDIANVSVLFELTCNGTVTAYDQDCTTGQSQVRYVSVTVEDTYTPLFPIHFGTGADGAYSLSATAGVRVE